MKSSLFIAVLLITGAIFYFTDGDMMLGLKDPQNLPDTVAPPNSTFLGDEVINPYFAK
jgi:hypothetical protein